jgi:hypothetical protein
MYVGSLAAKAKPLLTLLLLCWVWSKTGQGGSGEKKSHGNQRQA